MKRSRKNDNHRKAVAFTADITGFQHGDILVGQQGTCGSINGVMLVLFDDDKCAEIIAQGFGRAKEVEGRYYAPNTSRVDAVMKNETTGEALLRGLRSFSLFADLSKSVEDIMNSIKREGKKSQNIGWGMEGTLRLKVISPCLNFVQKLEKSPEVLVRMMSEDSWTPEQLLSLIPKEPGSKKEFGQHTLAFQSHRWAVASFRPLTRVPSGTRVVRVAQESGSADAVNNVWDCGDGLAVSVPQDATVCSVLDPEALLKDMAIEYTKEQILAVDASLNKLGAITFKSALQKLIRYSPQSCVLENGLSIPTDVVLAVTIARLYNSPGTFNPEIGKWMSGFQSIAKRLAVIAFEDSMADSLSDIVELLAMALLTQRVNIWKPSYQMLLKCTRIAVQLLHCPDTYVYNAKYSGNPYTFHSAANDAQLCSALLDVLGSFGGDLRMVRHIASGKRETVCWRQRPLMMPFPMHAIDQHVCPSFIYFMQPQTVKKWNAGSSQGAPFQRFLTNLFERVTGVNPRRSLDVTLNDEVLEAQQMWLRAKQNTRNSSGEEKQLTTISFQPPPLAVDWLAGMVGGITVKVGRKNYLVSLKPSDPHTRVAIPAPARSKHIDREMTQEDDALVEAKRKMKMQLMSNGAKLKDVPVKSLKGLTVVLKQEPDGSEWFQLSNGQSWEQARKLPRSNYSVSVDCWASFDVLIGSCSSRTLRRLNYYMTSKGGQLEMNLVSRDGGSLKLMCVFEDIACFQLLMKIAQLFPCCLKHSKSGVFSFNIVDRPFFWHLSSLVHTKIRSAEDVSLIKWDSMTDRRGFVEWEHQKESRERVVHARKQHHNGAFIYIPVGLGKTKIVMETIASMQASSALPKYVIFTCPSSALLSVAKEIVPFIDCNMLVPLKSMPKRIKEVQWPSGCTVSVGPSAVPTAGVVTLIDHDHLRRCDSLTNIAPDCLLVVDEVHKTLRYSQRTGHALELASLSNFFIAMTGTPIVDSKATGLLRWLQRVSLFDVTDRSLWVASNNMIAYKISTGVFVELQQSVAPMSLEEKEIHHRNAPIAMGGTNANATNSNFIEMARVALGACTRHMVELTKSYLMRGEGELGGTYTVKHMGDDEQVHILKMIDWELHCDSDVELVCGDTVISQFPFKVPEELKCLFRSGSFLLDGKRVEPMWAPEKVMLVAQDQRHMERLKDALELTGVPESRIKLGAHHLTDQSVEEGDTDFHVVIVPLPQAEGYSLTRMGVQITSVYPSNQAKREQMAGRINRLCQRRSTIRYVTVHAGILSVILKNHMSAANLSAALASIAQLVEGEDVKENN